MIPGSAPATPDDLAQRGHDGRPASAGGRRGPGAPGLFRRRVQAVSDRRFYRHRYHAAQALAEFGASLRDEADLSQLTERLVVVVYDTMQTESVFCV